jgi:hypothetical protein
MPVFDRIMMTPKPNGPIRMGDEFIGMHEYPQLNALYLFIPSCRQLEFLSLENLGNINVCEICIQHSLQSAHNSSVIPEQDPQRQRWDPNNHPQHIDRSSSGYTELYMHPVQTDNVS